MLSIRCSRSLGTRHARSLDGAAVTALSVPSRVTGRAQVGVLGPTTLMVDGQPIALHSSRTRRLVAALALGRGRPMSADALCDAVWGERLPKDPAAALHNQISRLRTLLGGASHVLVTTPGGYCLAPAPGDVDAYAFESDLAVAMQAPDLEPGDRAGLLTGTVGRWRGRAYADLDTDDARAEATRLGELRFVAQEAAATALLAAGDARTAAAGLASLCTAEPLRESARLALAEALAADHRTADALRTLGDFRRLLVTELGVDPSPALASLELAILEGRAGERHGAAVAVPGHETIVRPPRVTVQVFGRDQDCEGVRALVASRRLVTIVGPGGVGKTTLAQVVADAAAGDYGSGAAYVDLAAAMNPDAVRAAFLRGLGLERRAGVEWQDRLVEALVGQRLLLLIDNAERVVDVVAPAVDKLLQNTRVDVLVTSREPLKLRAERLWPLDPLSFDDGPEASAILMLHDRGMAVRPDWQLDADELVNCAEICRQLDGLPLAIELAAAHLRTLSSQQLLRRLQDPLQLLDAGARSPARHRSLRAMVDWSYAFLGEPERAVLDRLGVFAADFSLPSATRVCADLDLPEREVAQVLRDLVDRSLVQADVGAERTRYRLLETLRHFANERLSMTGHLEEARDRHASLFLELAEQAVPGRWSRDEGFWRRMVDDERAELPVALRSLLERGRLDDAARLAVACYLTLFDRGRDEVVDMLESVVTLDLAGRELSSGWALAFGCAAERAITGGDLARGKDLIDQAGMVATPDQPSMLFVSEGAAGDLALFNGRTDAAIEHYQRAAKLVRERGLPSFAALLDAVSALPLAYANAFGDARRVASAALEAAASTGCPSAIAMASYVLAEAVAQEDPSWADELLAAAVAGAEAVGNVFVSGLAHLSQATRAARTGDAPGALRHYRNAYRQVASGRQLEPAMDHPSHAGVRSRRAWLSRGSGAAARRRRSERERSSVG